MKKLQHVNTVHKYINNIFVDEVALWLGSHPLGNLSFGFKIYSSHLHKVKENEYHVAPGAFRYPGRVH